MKIGDVIRRARRKKDLTQKKLGCLIGINPMQIYYWEKNKDIPRGNHLLIAMKILDLKMEDFNAKETDNVQPDNIPVQQ